MPGPDVSLDRSELVAVFLESIVYGMFVIFYFILLYIAYWSEGSKDRLPRRRYILPIATLMLLIATAHLVIDFLRDMKAFMPTPSDTINDKFFKVLSHPYAILNWVLYAIQTLLGDAVLVWRCYAVCDKKWWVLIPGGLILAVNTAVMVVVSHYLTFTIGAAFIHFTLPWMTVWMSMTAVLQIIYSSAVVYQISRKFDRSKHSTAVIRAFVESSALYTLFDLALLIAFERASDADWVLIDVITPLVGITFCLIIIQLHFQFGNRVHEPTALSTAAFQSRGGATGQHEYHSMVFNQKKRDEHSCGSLETGTLTSGTSPVEATMQSNGSVPGPIAFAPGPQAVRSVNYANQVSSAV